MANEDFLVVKDLFGNQRYLKPRTRGRPPFEWTQENSNKVSMLLAMGWANERIAGCILDPRTGKPISVPTLKRHFRSELQVRAVARDQLFARRIERIWEAAERGVITAERELDRLIERNDQMLADAYLGDKASKKTQPALGKKKLDQEAAKLAEMSLEEELEAEAANARQH